MLQEGKKNPSDFFFFSLFRRSAQKGSQPHWPWEIHHVARDEGHVTYFLPNPWVCWKGGCTHC